MNKDRRLFLGSAGKYIKGGLAGLFMGEAWNIVEEKIYPSKSRPEANIRRDRNLWKAGTAATISTVFVDYLFKTPEPPK